MKKIVAFLAAAVMLCMAAVPSLAASVYPSEVIMTEVGTGYEIRKSYQLLPGDNPEDIDIAGFVRGGIAYSFAELLKEETEFTGARPHSQTVTIASPSQDMGKVLPLFDMALDVETEDGFSGTLHLDHTSIRVEADGYKSGNYTVTATRVYPNLSDADIALVPKSTEEKGQTLELEDVTWQDTEGGYTASATYTRLATSRTATGYTATAEYTGTVYLTVPGPVAYTAIFEGTPEAVEVADDTPEPEPEPPLPLAQREAGKVAIMIAITVTAIVAFVGGWYIRKRRRG